MGQTEADFVKKWKNAKGGERAQAQSFIIELCHLMQTSVPHDGDYKFEYSMKGAKATDFADLYKRGCFVLEAKQSRAKGQKKAIPGQEDLFIIDAIEKAGTEGRTWDVLMENARQQAIRYAQQLPQDHDWPPFILVCDVGNCIEVYADFSGKGRRYEQFPDAQSFRARMDDFSNPEVLARFKAIWENPHSLNPATQSAKATREIAKALAEVSKRMEAKKYNAEEVALFLMRCLFTMFAEDTELIDKDSFTDLLTRSEASPDSFMPNLEELWRHMNAGGFSVAIGKQVKRFNGKLFADAKAFPMDKEEIGVLKAAAKKDWKEVDPSIFGTLLEQALSTKDRASLGAHYTPRAYVERLVQATVMDPLWQEWEAVKGTVGLEPAEAVARVSAFHKKLCETRVFDPACGTGNFLYVTMELMKKLEGDVLDTLGKLGGQEALRLENFTIDPHQFLGIEINPRAAAIAELVIWIGYLRWHLRTTGGHPAEPILREFKNIERRDAVLLHDGPDKDGKLKNPRRPEWPEAEYIVGNPPFIAGQNFRREFGDGYVEALWSINKHISGGADFVMYWWDRAAELLTLPATKLKSFGLVTTNSITQTFQMRVVAHHLIQRNPISLKFAIPDHPWTKVTPDAAAVQIAFTVGIAGSSAGTLMAVQSATAVDTDNPTIKFSSMSGKINADLTIGADLTNLENMKANLGIAHDGVKLHGTGFVLSHNEAMLLGLGRRQDLEKYVRPLRNGRDLAGTPRGALVIDLFGLDPSLVRNAFPEIYQHLLRTVKIEREKNNRASYRDFWWIFGEPRKELRPALVGLDEYIATIDTAKHRVFQLVDATTICDDGIVIIASNNHTHLGMLSSRFHVVWSLRQGSLLGPTPRYNKSRCFDPFPFPAATDEQQAAIGRIAETLDKHRKDVQAAHPEITLTKMYNVLEKVKSGQQEGLNADEKLIFDHGLILILKELHEELDVAVAAAYGWPVDLEEEEVLARLVALNKKRAAEEAKGFVRWLRPDYQIPRFGSVAEKQAHFDMGEEQQIKKPVEKKDKPTFPTAPVAQGAAIMAALALAEGHVTAANLASTFKQGKKCEARVAETLKSLAATGYVSAFDKGTKFSSALNPTSSS